MTHTSLRVLIVDDNKDGADSLLLLLQAYGVEPRAAYDGESGLRLARSFRPDVVLVDLALPRLDGCAVARRVRLGACVPPPLLVAVTGFGDAGHLRDALGEDRRARARVNGEVERAFVVHPRADDESAA